VCGLTVRFKLGHLLRAKLRQYAKDQLGDKFNIRDFHDEVLGAGALPLDVLEKRIHEWVAKQKLLSAPSATTFHSVNDVAW
jgi:uncharacterized protein (DUF885 family)